MNDKTEPSNLPADAHNNSQLLSDKHNNEALFIVEAAKLLNRKLNLEERNIDILQEQSARDYELGKEKNENAKLHHEVGKMRAENERMRAENERIRDENQKSIMKINAILAVIIVISFFGFLFYVVKNGESIYWGGIVTLPFLLSIIKSAIDAYRKKNNE